MFRLKSSEFRVYLTNTSALSSYLVMANVVRPNFWILPAQLLPRTLNPKL